MEEPRQTSALETMILLLSLAVKLFYPRVYILRVVTPPTPLPTMKPPSLQVLTALILISPP